MGLFLCLSYIFFKNNSFSKIILTEPFFKHPTLLKKKLFDLQICCGIGFLKFVPLKLYENIYIRTPVLNFCSLGR